MFSATKKAIEESKRYLSFTERLLEKLEAGEDNDTYLYEYAKSLKPKSKACIKLCVELVEEIDHELKKAYTAKGE